MTAQFLFINVENPKQKFLSKRMKSAYHLFSCEEFKICWK